MRPVQQRTLASGGTDPLEQLVIQAHVAAYTRLRSHRDLADQLRRWLGRPLVARLTGMADPNNVSRWARGVADPEPGRVAKMRLAAEAFIMLTQLFGSEDSARDWFTGANPFLNYEMPVDVIRNGESERIHRAVRAIAAI